MGTTSVRNAFNWVHEDIRASHKSDWSDRKWIFPLQDSDLVSTTHPRLACVLLLETSAAMVGGPINELNTGLSQFAATLKEDPLASLRVEPAIVTFGDDGVKVERDFALADKFDPPVLRAGGSTPMGEGIRQALSLLRKRKDAYRRNSISMYRPWLFLITDGAPTDAWQDAAEDLAREENAKGVMVFAVGVQNADFAVLNQISRHREAMALTGTDFGAMFSWLSASLILASREHPNEFVTQVSLAPITWGTVPI